MSPRMVIALLAAALIFPTAAQAATPDQIEKERRIAACINTARASAGLPALAYDPALGRAARLHARNMRTYRFFDHTDTFGRDPAQRVAKFTARYGEGVGENIAEGQRFSGEACRGWLASPGHRANILNPDYTAMGTGYTGGRRFWVQDFGIATTPAEEEDPPDVSY